MIWKYRLLVYGDSDAPKHFMRKWTIKEKAIAEAQRLIQMKGIKKVEVLPRGLAILKNEVVTIQ